MVSRIGFSEQEFLASVRQYWSNYAVARELDRDGKPGRHMTPGGLSENAFYVFDAESMNAVRHAIEDLALEEANGKLLSAFPCETSFAPQRERYTHIAMTLEHLDLIVAGASSGNVPHARFIRDGSGVTRDYCVTLYEGKRHQAGLVGRQSNKAKVVDDRQYEGFYTFNPKLIAKLRREIREVAAGRLPLLKEWHRLRLLDQVSKQIKSEFAREEEAIEAAMQRLLLDDERYQPAQFASDLERRLSRLIQWKDRLPEMLARANMRP